MRRHLTLLLLVLLLTACGDTVEEASDLPTYDSETTQITETAAMTDERPTETSATGQEQPPDDSESTSTSTPASETGVEAHESSTASTAAPSVEASEETTPSTVTQGTEPPDPAVPDGTAPTGGVFDASLTPLVDEAVADLSGRLGVDASDITVVGAELVEWSDASLGCPQPGMVYAQVPTDGSLIRLSAGGTEYRYHTGGTTYTPFLCER